MTRRTLLPALALLIGLFFALSPPAFAQPLQTHYLPLLAATPVCRAGFGLEVVPGTTAMWQGDLAEIRACWFRSGFGSQVDPLDTLYQHYLAGGWAEVDAEVAAELEIWREVGASPLVIFMYGGACQVPSIAQLKQYGNFIVAAANRYDLPRFEVWNEPDASGGYASLYGCFGTAHTDRLIYLLNYVNNRTARHVGVSFAGNNETQMQMLAAAAPYADWIGIHHYSVWGGGIVMEPWPGGLVEKYEMAVANAAGRPVWVTEYNLRSPGDEFGITHQQAQADMIAEALALDLPLVSILVYYSYPDWQATGIRNTIVESWLAGGGYPAP